MLRTAPRTSVFAGAGDRQSLSANVSFETSVWLNVRTTRPCQGRGTAAVANSWAPGLVENLYQTGLLYHGGTTRSAGSNAQRAATRRASTDVRRANRRVAGSAAAPGAGQAMEKTRSAPRRRPRKHRWECVGSVLSR